MARPKIEINWSNVDRMLEAGCTGTEVAASLGIHDHTLYNRCKIDNKVSFSDYLAQKRASGNRLLRVEQFKLAMQGDRSMLIWLGKNRLEQTEKQSHVIENLEGLDVSIVNKDWDSKDDD